MKTLLCPADIVHEARQFAALVPEGEGMFSRACGTYDPFTGTTTTTHYLSHYTVAVGHLAELLPYNSWQQDEQGEWQATDHGGNVEAMLAALGITNPTEQAAALGILSQIDISDQSAEAACARLGIGML